MRSPQQNQFITSQQQQSLYFIELLSRKPHDYHLKIAEFSSRRILEHVAAKIEEGRFEIGGIQQRVDKLLEEKELSESAKRLMVNQKKREEKKMQHRLLYPNSKGFETLSEEQYPHNILSPEKHKEFLREVKIEKKQREQKITQIREKEEEKRRRSLTQIEQASEEERMGSVEKKKLQIQFNLQKMRENHEKLMLNERHTKHIVNKIRNKKRLHQYLKETYQRRIVLPILEENKKILKERKANSRLDISEIQSHQKEYLQWKKSQQSLERSSPSKSSYHPPPRSKKMNRILAEQKEKRHSIQKQKQFIKQKIQRVNNYTIMLKQREGTPTINKTVATTDREATRRQTEASERDNLKRNSRSKCLEQARKVLRKRSRTEEGHESVVVFNINDKIKLKTMSQNNIEIKRQQKSTQKTKNQQIQTMLNCRDLNETEKLKRIKEANEKISAWIKKKQQKLQLQFDKTDRQSVLNLLLAATRAKLTLLKCYDGLDS